jgi:hypothetical protein
MLNTFCVECGAVNHIGEQNCVGCGAHLAPQPAFETREWQPFTDPRKALPGIGPFNISHVLPLTLKLFTRHIWLITKIVFLVVTPFEVFKALSLSNPREEWQPPVALLLGWVCNLLIAPALIYAFMKILETGVTPGVNESFRWGLGKVGRLGLCAAMAALLQGLGYIFCIIPGIIVSLTFAVVYPVAILEHESGAEVLSRSSQLTRGFRLEILGTEILLGLLGLLLMIPATLIVTQADSVPLVIVASICKDVLVQAMTVLSLVIYLSLVRTPRHGHSMFPLP